MKLARYSHQDTTGLALVHDQFLYPLSSDPNLPTEMAELLHQFDDFTDAVEALLENTQHRLALDKVQLLAPIARPGKFIGVGLNYDDHIAETGLERPTFPTLFNKQSTCVIGPNQAIHRPNVSEKLDYEGELALVIGKRCRNISADEAKQVIAGYTIVNDVSVRDWQIKSPTWTLGKSFDTHGPMGPWIVTADEIQPDNLELKTWLNDELRQHSNTRHLIFDCYQLVETLSSVCTLEPGDIIATGTCSGVGVKMKPRGYMKPGDIVTIEIEDIGRLSNPVIQEPKSNRFIE